MRRAPIVLTSTACGVVALVSYHAAVPQASALTSSAPARSTSAGAATKASSAKTATAAPPSKAAATRAHRQPPGRRRPRLAPPSAVTRSIPYGDIEVKVTMTGTRITDVTVVKHDVTDPRSQMIDQIAVPQLRSQALAVQSAKIDGVSGASYTSAAYEQSLQSAIDKLKA